MRRIVFLLVGLALAVGGCQTPPGTSADGPGPGQWTYVKGPHGENCLIFSNWLGTQQGWLAMDCDSVKP